jgi:hypothetical protein
MDALYVTGANLEWIQIAKKLQDKLNWSPKYWIGPEYHRNEVKQKFSDVTFHDSKDATRGIKSINEWNSGESAIDQSHLVKYQDYEYAVLRSLNRVDSGYSFSFDERVRTYQITLAYWLGVIDTYQFDVAVFAGPPILPNELLAYAVCQENEIPTLVRRFTKIPEICYITDSLTNDNPQFAQYVADVPTVSGDISTKTLDYLQSVKFGHEIISYSKPDANVRGKLTNVGAYLRYIGKLPREAGVIIKSPNEALEHSRTSWLDYAINKIQGYIFKRSLKNNYDKLAHKSFPKSKYVYIPLHYQPEMSTVPLGGKFANQLLLIKLVSDVIPDDWKIAVKEHPGQFNFDKNGEHSRFAYYYKDIADMNKTRLVDMSLDSVKLIRHAKTVVTATGTAGWEAVLMGTPAIVFGNPWYRCCEGVYHVKNKNDLLDAFVNIRKNPDVNQEKVLSFIYALEKKGFRGYKDKLSMNSDISSQDHISNVSNAIVKYAKYNDI